MRKAPLLLTLMLFDHTLHKIITINLSWLMWLLRKKLVEIVFEGEQSIDAYFLRNTVYKASWMDAMFDSFDIEHDN